MERCIIAGCLAAGKDIIPYLSSLMTYLMMSLQSTSSVHAKELVISAIGATGWYAHQSLLKASLGSKRVLFSYFINTEPTELKLSQIASPGKSNAVNFFQKVSYIFSHGMQPSWIECCV